MLLKLKIALCLRDTTMCMSLKTIRSTFWWRRSRMMCLDSCCRKSNLYFIMIRLRIELYLELLSKRWGWNQFKIAC